MIRKKKDRLFFKKANYKNIKLKKIKVKKGEKLLNASKTIKKNFRVKTLLFWMRIVAVMICVLIALSGIILYHQYKQGKLNISSFVLNAQNTLVQDSNSDSSVDSEIQSDDDVLLNERLLQYVNIKHPIDRNYTPKLIKYENVLVSADMAESLDQMIKDAKKEGLDLKVKTAYVTYEEQQKLYDDKFDYYVKTLGYSSVKAEASLIKTLPNGDASEHRTGLNVSFYDNNKTDFSQSDAYKWLMRNCVEYGFILRYPENTESYTSMESSYDEFRFVGKDNAMKMRTLGMCLEQYNEYLESR